ncbi:MAG: hypothetical protein IPK16_01335 [Anaerolineales bacterium]|nr:hypothetical protein [Anaerolineales bacterium]
MKYTQRFYQDDADYAAMHQLIIESYAATAPHHYMTPGDLDWWCGLKEDPTTFLPTVPLWFAGAELIAYVWPAPGNADLLVHPAHRDVEPELLDWAVANLAAPEKDDEPPSLTVWSLETDTYRNELLAASGFAPGPEFYSSFLWN